MSTTASRIASLTFATIAAALFALPAAGEDSAPTPPEGAAAPDAPPAPERRAPDAPFTIRASSQTEQQAQADPQSGDVVMIAYPLSALLSQAHGVHPLDMIAEGGVDLDKRYDVLLRAGPQRDRNLREMLKRGVPHALGLELEVRPRKVPINRLRVRAGDPPLAPSTAESERVEVAKGRLEAVRLPIAELVAFLRWRSPRPVVDETKLAEAYDFVLEWDAAAGTPALFYALQDIGLEIVPDDAEFPFLVVRPTP